MSTGSAGAAGAAAGAPTGAPAARESYLDVVRRLAAAQKPAARSAPAYSRYVNRRIGRYLAAWAYRAGLSPNAVTAISAVWTFAAIAILVVLPPSWWSGIAAAVLLLVGYAFDSADGQVSRLAGLSSPAGEWLDHMVDSLKVVTMPLALAVGFWLHDSVPTWWLLIPVAFSIVSSVLFFGMILTEQLRRQRGRASIAADAPGRPSWMRAIAVLPMDYGVLCLSFVLLGALPVFLVVYTLLFAATTAFLLLAAASWFRELRAPATPDTHLATDQRQSTEEGRS
ncbi:CDP-alcohol phosphatidyltransferase family protein [Leifsonia sp. NPDC102414]|uniref:CDP-alcohol phosphatidyltransferase family protein n=1 Tax=unclassified Leifsonia TaxID=2663824 RepID=UPI0009EC06E3|nr:CDP-alcohol phosphatidyltransferase family protein [Leifsonia sp. Root227]